MVPEDVASQFSKWTDNHFFGFSTINLHMEKLDGVGIFVAEKWVDSVVSVKGTVKEYWI